MNMNIRFEEVIRDTGASERAFATHVLKVQHDKVHKMIKKRGPKPVDQDIIERLEENHPQLNIPWLVTGEGEKYKDPKFDPKTLIPENVGLRNGGNRIDADLIERLRGIRMDKGLSQKDFSEEMNISKGTQTQIEGYRQNPSLQYLQLLRTKFGADLNHVITGLGPKYIGETIQNMEEYNVNKLKQEIKELKLTNKVLAQALAAKDREDED